jgi:pterin-4a-carbinolamine dehydratase
MNFAGVSKAIIARLSNYGPLMCISHVVTYEKMQDTNPATVGGDPNLFESDAAIPYTVVEDVASNPWDTKTSDGGDQLIQVTTYCRPKDFNSATDLANQTAQAAYDALHKFDLVVSGSNVVNCLFEESPGLITDPDGVTRYRPMTFRVVYDGGE